MSGFSDRPKILKGAFVEYGKSTPRLVVPFQFNPETISRQRSNTFSVPGGTEKVSTGEKKARLSLRTYHQRFENLSELRDNQGVDIGPETISFDIRLDATDNSQGFGIAPQLSTLELMMYPRVSGPGETAIPELLGQSDGYTFTGKEKPPMLLFVWGKKKVLPVNLTSMSIKEEQFDPNLNSIRATVTVNLTVIEGPNAHYLKWMGEKEAISKSYLTGIPTAETFIPK